MIVSLIPYLFQDNSKIIVLFLCFDLLFRLVFLTSSIKLIMNDTKQLSKKKNPIESEDCIHKNFLDIPLYLAVLSWFCNPSCFVMGYPGEW